MSEERQYQIFKVDVIWLYKTIIDADLVQGTNFDQVLKGLKAMNIIPNYLDNGQFKITNLSEGRQFEQVQLNHKVEELGIGRLLVMIQIQEKKPQKSLLQLQNIKLNIFSSCRCFEIQAHKQIILKDLVDKLKDEVDYNKDVELILVVQGVGIDDEITLGVAAQIYKDKDIELIEQQIEVSQQFQYPIYEKQYEKQKQMQFEDTQYIFQKNTVVKKKPMKHIPGYEDILEEKLSIKSQLLQKYQRMFHQKEEQCLILQRQKRKLIQEINALKLK